MIYGDAIPSLKAGESKQETLLGHLFVITATRESGIHSGRTRYRVYCLTCDKRIHPATTGPYELAGYHADDPSFSG